MSYVNSPQPGRYTTTRLVPLTEARSYRSVIVASALTLCMLGAVAFANIRAARPIQEEAPQIARQQVVYIISTPTPQPLPTAAPAIMAAPPTAEPEVIYQTVEVPVEVPIYVSAPQVEVNSAPVETAPAPEPTPIAGWTIHAPVPVQPGQCVQSRGGGICWQAAP